MVTAQKKIIYSIPAGEPFADTLAAWVLKRAAAAGDILPHYRIFLPTRRACRIVREAFLRQSEGKPLLLPRLQALGDIDAEELELEIIGLVGAEAMPDIPPAIDSLSRKILMTRLILARPDFNGSMEQALTLADALARLFDSLHTENVPLSALATLVPDDFSDHWKISLDFLTLIAESWHGILSERGIIDPADRRNRLLRLLTEHWKHHPPATPIIAAGSTGSIPATADLLKTIASLPQGCIILPGLDTRISDADRDTIPESHPQFLMMQLLAHCDANISDIAPIFCDTIRSHAKTPKSVLDHKTAGKRLLVHQIMLPADSAAQWAELKASLNETERHSTYESLQNVTLMTFEAPRHEATGIALLLRETLSTDGMTAALVTPDRGLARRVVSACQRWGIAVNDSAGEHLHETPAGRFFLLVSQAAQARFSASTLLALLKHPLCQTDANEVNRLDVKALRNRPAPKDWNALQARINDLNLRVIAAQIEPLLTLQMTQQDDQQIDSKTILDRHIKVAEALAGGSDALWQHDDGEALATLLSDLRQHLNDLPLQDGESYIETLEHFLSAATVRPSYGTHPRLTILGQLEARLFHADRIILAGLNEGTFPSDPAADPWMSRPMRQKCGLPSPERSIGQAAHDFVQGFCANEVFLTRSRRVDGTPTTPARWLQRFDTVLQALDISSDALNHNDAPYTLWAHDLDSFDEKSTPVARPAPKPPVEKRPRKLSVTKIETWIRDPYALYADKILKLRELDPLENDEDAAERGTLMHDILERFVKLYPDQLPNDALDQLIAIGKNAFGERLHNPSIYAFWWTRFERLAAWFVEQERDHRVHIIKSIVETTGTMTLPAAGGAFTLTGKADRIDMMRDGTASILDYKTGTPPSSKQVLSGLSPQLPLEGAILMASGFPDIPPCSPSALTFWKMSGGSPAGEVKPIKCDDLTKLCQEAKDGLLRLVAHFDNVETAYISLPRPAIAPTQAYQTYRHLARVAEWSAYDQDTEQVA